ncbi:MAG: hypothetical protein HYU58_12070 [Proteobacteria bacterium]|nr:hypothetical protein [Pseudomonadota bacterium]
MAADEGIGDHQAASHHGAGRHGGSGLGRAVSETREHVVTAFEDWPGYGTMYPSYLLRIPDTRAKAEAHRALVADIKRISKLAATWRAYYSF